MAIFFHSFITKTYIAHLQGDNSEALPTPARSNNTDSNCRRNAREWVLGSDRRTKRMLFQTEGPSAVKHNFAW